MTDILLTAVFVSAILVPVFLGALALSLAAKRDAKKVNPLTKSLRRPPGGHLTRQLVGLYFDLAASLGMLSLSVALPISIYLFQSHVMQKPDSMVRLIIISLVTVAMLVIFIRKLIQQRNRIQTLRLGYECELAVGQELDQLMHEGFHVFHDIPADDFNIDHLVVGPNGVIAVETKGRSKRLGTAGPDKADYIVEYENGVLKFPGWRETAPIKQATLNAQWVSQWLTSATGFSVKVKGILVFPGWYIDRKPPNPVPVLAVGKMLGFFKKFSVQVLSEQELTQIVYQVEQKTMDLKPGDSMRPLEESS